MPAYTKQARCLHPLQATRDGSF
ncbi:protein of unknown function [Alcaligenes faecalis subsp. faecalis]|nr:protein of unknown function [Alcaligenes faecalis subsp. faecalis]